MKFPKITKTLPLVLALAMTTSCAFAATAETQSSQTANYELTLDTFFDIDVTAPGEASSTSFNEDYSTIKIDNALVGVFEVISNTPEKTYYLHSQCEADSTMPALFQAEESLGIVFTNQEAGSKATDEAVQHILDGNQTTTESANAIAFAFKEDYSHEETPTNGWLEDGYSFDETTGKITYKVANGKHTMTYTVQDYAINNSFSTMDRKGTYKATLILTDAATLTP